MTPHPAKVQTMDVFVVSCHDINVTRRLCQPPPQKSHVDRLWTSRPLTPFRQCCHWRCHNDQAHDATALQLGNPPMFPTVGVGNMGADTVQCVERPWEGLWEGTARPQGRDEPSTSHKRHTLEVRGSGSNREGAGQLEWPAPCLSNHGVQQRKGCRPTTARTWA